MNAPDHGDTRARFRRTLTQVLAVQIVTLFLLWLVQAVYAT